MSKLQTMGEPLVSPAIAATPPVGAVGIDLTAYRGAMRPSKWLITVVITVAPSDIILYGCLPLGVPNDETDDSWGLFHDVYGNVNDGVLKTAAAIGTHHFVVEDVGVFQRLAIVKSAGTVTGFVTPIAFSNSRGN